MFYHGNALTTSNMEKAAKRENSLEGNTQESCLHKVSLGTGLTGDFLPATSSIEVGTQGRMHARKVSCHWVMLTPSSCLFLMSMYRTYNFFTQEASTVIILRKVIKSLRSHLRTAEAQSWNLRTTL